MINTESFEFDSVYHIFSHVNGKELIFREETNYQFFLKKLMQYILPIADIYAYCLMANHFHLLVRFKAVEGVPIEDEHAYLMKHFGNFLNSYAKAFNKMYERKGALFLNAIKRRKITDEKYLLKVLHYIHNNPVNHGFVTEVALWKYSSYMAYVNSEKESKLNRNEILQYFDSVHIFENYHQSNVEYDFLDVE
ncbi:MULTISPECIES: transposase [Chryseobacterium]|uniref:Transposase n=1 Tax=Chryseobacterium camelliae TaxID=1265445 RepID=A0ABU0TNZ5_9FLAO|nr:MULTISPECIES: transposase [Chryseobacterium]MDT3407398.1 putative transposase [Pseudacidovorax intermedius]MDQ1098753.1 putative transposase [Chryseobacterium camelliae]MDQ1102677.1 putative transposase [Chryseobacterium sp. SORGH_AS_1048]MDR6086105.1 putative transposase [Chryseobacterium sp. SORGH_AS_0909]MDR6130475.1 putative transposase [Chryseobacterium sp. SORGH_AS_1175]